MSNPQPERETNLLCGDIRIAKRVYGFLTLVFAVLGLGLFFYFAYCTCGAAGILVASTVFFLAAWAFVRYVLLC